MEAMSTSISRLCQMVHDAVLRPGTKERLQVVLLEAARARGRLDDSFVSLFDEVLVGFLDKFTIVKKLVDDLRVDVGDYVNGVLLCQVLRSETTLRWTFSGVTAGSRRATSAPKRLSP